MILIAWDVGLDIFKQNTKSIKSRHSFIQKYMDDKQKDEDIRNIVSHTIGEVEPAYDLK